MGKSCSKTANVAELEKRRIERETRLGITPRSIVPSPRNSLQDSRISRFGNQSSGSHPIIIKNSTPRHELSVPTPRMYSRTNMSSSTSSPWRRSQQHPSIPTPLLSHHPPLVQGRPPLPPKKRLVSKSVVRPVDNTQEITHKGPSYPPSGSRKIMAKNPTEKPQSNSKIESKNLIKPTVKPVMKQALYLLCLEEIQSRSELINEAMNHFSILEGKFVNLIGLETIRRAAFELFSLETKSRQAVYEQEKSERKLLMFWVNQTLEEDRLMNLIEKTQKRHKISKSPSPSSQSVPIMHLSPSKTSNKQIVRSKEKLSFNNYNYGGSNIENEELFKTSIEEFSSGFKNIGSLVESDILSDDLNRKIGRQTHLIREVNPSYTPKSVSFSPRIGSNNFLREQEYDEMRLRSPKRCPSRPVPDLPYQWREISPLRSQNYDPYITPLRNSSANLKGESDLAMRRRIAALLKV